MFALMQKKPAAIGFARLVPYVSCCRACEIITLLPYLFVSTLYCWNKCKMFPCAWHNMSLHLSYRLLSDLKRHKGTDNPSTPLRTVNNYIGAWKSLEWGPFLGPGWTRDACVPGCPLMLLHTCQKHQMRVECFLMGLVIFKPMVSIYESICKTDKPNIRLWCMHCA